MAEKLSYYGFTADMESVMEREDITALSVSDTRNNIGDVLDRVHFTKERVVLTKHSKPYAAVVGQEDLLRLEVFDQIINSKMMAEYDQSTLSKGVGTSLEAFAAEYTPSKKHGTG